MKPFAGTGGLLRLLFRRDRIRMPVWIMTIAAFTSGFVPLFEEFLLKDTEPVVFMSLMENPAMIAIAGPVYGRAHYHPGAAYANMMLIFCVLLAVLMNIFLVVRHTRVDEETGRTEMIRAQPVGRAANLSAVFLSAIIANALLALLTAGLLHWMAGEGMTAGGHLLFGAALGVSGLFFAGLTAVLAQVSENTRTVSAMGLLLMLAMYLWRGAGDLYSETLARFSPLGLILRIQLYVRNEWWPVWILLVAGLTLAVLSFVLAGRRDLGAGLVAARSGKRHGSPLLASPMGLSFRLLRNTVIVWILVVFSVATMYASVFGEMEAFIQTSDMIRQIFAANPDFTALEQFVSLLNALMAILTAIPVMGTVHRMVTEEASGRIENLYGRAVARGKNFAAWLIPAFLLSILLQGIVALSFWSVGSYVTDQTPSLQTFLLSAASYLPAIWLMAALSAFLSGGFPKLRVLSYLYLGVSFLVVYIGSVAGFSDWLFKLTPFGYVPQYPVERMKILPLLILSALSLVLVFGALYLYRRRDLQTE